LVKLEHVCALWAQAVVVVIVSGGGGGVGKRTWVRTTYGGKGFFGGEVSGVATCGMGRLFAWWMWGKLN